MRADLALMVAARALVLNDGGGSGEGAVLADRIGRNAAGFVVGAHHAAAGGIDGDMAGQTAVRRLAIERAQPVAIHGEGVDPGVVADFGFLHGIQKAPLRINRQIGRIAGPDSRAEVVQFAAVRIEAVGVNACGLAVDKGQFFGIGPDVHCLFCHCRLPYGI